MTSDNPSSAGLSPTLAPAPAPLDATPEPAKASAAPAAVRRTVKRHAAPVSTHVSLPDDARYRSLQRVWPD